jgi:hypothetical protein
VRVIVLDAEALASGRVEDRFAGLVLRHHPRAKRVSNGLKQRAQRLRQALPRAREQRVEAIAPSRLHRSARWLPDRGCGDAEPQQNLIEEDLRAVLVAHAVAREHDDRCVGVGVLQYFPDGSVDRDVYVLDRIAGPAGLLDVVPRVPGSCRCQH